MHRLDRRNKLLSYGKSHFWFDIGDKRYGYCYIRKNACSTFKKLISQTSEVSDFKNFSGSELQFMEAHHRIRSFEQINSCNHMIFVCRDPYDRLISAFVNKFVMQTGHDEIFKSYEVHTGQNPQNASFRDFVVNYCKEFSEKDVHIFPQHLHLLPIRYDGVLNIDRLYEDIQDLIGPEVADEYFAGKANSSDYGQTQDPHADTPCGELNAMYREIGKNPSKAAFQDDDLRLVTQRRYSKDYQMISALREV